VKFYFTGTEFLYDNNANLSKAVAAKRLPLTILCGINRSRHAQQTRCPVFSYADINKSRRVKSTAIQAWTLSMNSNTKSQVKPA